MAWHNMPLAEIFQTYGSDSAKGLSAAQATQAAQTYGPNKLDGKKPKTLAARFLDQFKDFMVIILLLAALVSLVVAMNGHNRSEFLEPIVIIAIVLINATMGVLQENRAEKALEALQTLAAPLAKVVRDGALQTVPASEVVPGDLCLLEAGDFIPADGRLLEAASLKVEESALTGESLPAEKSSSAQVAEDAPLGDRANMVFSGCSVSYGRGKMVVVETGMRTQMGKIAQLLGGEEDGATPLQKKLEGLGKTLGIAALGICVLIFFMGLLSGLPLMEIFINSVSLAVAAIPEGLPAIVTIVLAIGVQRMVRKNAIVRQLPAVETLGSASVICSDKTGTLTQNRMTLMEIYAGEKVTPVEALRSSLKPEEKKLLEYAILCSDGRVVEEGGTVQHLGDPTETAIVYCGHMLGMQADALHAQYPRLAEIPFDSTRKLMSTINLFEGQPIVLVKGAVDVLLKRCVGMDVEGIQAVNTHMSKRALRVIAVGYKKIEEVPAQPESKELENGLTFLGLVGMIDPARPEAAEAVATCKKAGIRTVMITGDHVLTASAIARELGILEEGSLALTGEELAKLSEEELAERVEHTSVYARVSPEDKIRIVKAWQKRGHVVAMTGDGVNDAPALKAADIGCAMGITGTDVAKGAANMILTDDNFATIVHAVREGRGIYDNIKKAVKFLVSCNIGEILTVFFTMLLYNVAPLAAMHLLWINLVTDSMPALALGVEPVRDSIMARAPIPKNASIFSRRVIGELLFQGILFGGLTTLAYHVGAGVFGHIGGQTMAFLALSLMQLFHAFTERSEESIFKVGLTSNRAMLYAFSASLLLIVVVAAVPFMRNLFGLMQLPALYYVAVLGIALVPVVVMEGYKAFSARNRTAL